MRDEDSVVPFGVFEQSLANSRKIANSPQSEFDRLYKEEFGENEESPIASQIPSVEAPPNILEDMVGFAGKIGNRVKNAAGVIKDNPEQAAAGAGDMASNVVNFGLETKKAFDSWMSGNGFTYADLNVNEGVDIGGMIAPAPITDEDRMARGTGKFLSQFAAHVGTAMVGGAGAKALGAGAKAMAATGVASGGVASFLAFDPHEQKLADFFQGNSVVRELGLDFLANKKEDRNIDGRIKNGLESVLGDALGLAAYGAFKWYRTRRLMNAGSSLLKEGVEEGAEATAQKLAAKEAAGDATQLGDSSLTATPKPQGVDVQSTIDDSMAKTAPTQPDAPTNVTPPIDGAPNPTLNTNMDNANTVAAGTSVKAKMANEEALQAAERTAGQSAGGEAPNIEAPIKGQPVGRKVQEERAFGNPDRAVYGGISEEDFARLSKKVNLGKLDDEMKAGRVAGLEGVVDDIKVKPGTNESRAAASLKRLQNADRVDELLRKKQGDRWNAEDIEDAWMMSEVHWNRALELDEMAKGKNLSPDQMRYIDDQFEIAMDSFDQWWGIAESGGSVAGQALQASGRSAARSEAAKMASIIRSNSDVLGDATKMTYGTRSQKLNAYRQRLALKDDPRFVKAFKPGGEAHSLMKSGAKAIDVFNSYQVNNLLSGPATLVVNNPGSQVAKFVEYDYLLKLQNSKSNNILSKTLTLGLDKEAKVPLSVSEDLLAKYWGKTKAELKANPIPSEDIAAFRKTMELKIRNPDIALKVQAVSREGAINNGIQDMFRLKWLAEDGKFIPNASSKFGGIERKLSSEELEKLYARTDAAAILERGKLLTSVLFQRQKTGMPYQPVVQAMAIGDAAVGTIGANQAHHMYAMKYAIANAIDENHERILYNQAIANPPTWMRKLVTDQMQENNFASDLTKEGSPFFSKMEEWLKAPAFRSWAPFIRVPINMTLQALERAPIGAQFVSKRFRDNMALGAEFRDVALAKVELGRQVSVMAAGLASMGLLIGTGPRNPNMRQAYQNANPGFQTNSIKLGNTYVPLQTLGSFGSVLKFSADMYEIASHIPDHKMREWDNVMLTGLAAIVDNMMPDFLADESGHLSDLLKNPEDDRVKKYLAQRVVSAAVPASGAMRFIRKQVDPERRKVDADKTNDTWDVLDLIVNNFKNIIPGFSDDLPPNRNVWGDTVEYTVPGTGPENTSAIAYAKDKDLSVEDEVVRLGMTSYLYSQEFDEGDERLRITMPRKAISYEGVNLDLNPQQYDDYILLAAGDFSPMLRGKHMTEDEVKEMSKLNTKARIKEMISAPEWKSPDMPDKNKRIAIAEIISESRKLAKDYLMQIHPDLQMRLQLNMISDQISSLPEGDPQRGELRQEQDRIRRSYSGDIGL